MEANRQKNGEQTGIYYKEIEIILDSIVNDV